MTQIHTTRSSFISEISYDEAEKVLRLTMKGGTYDYKDVPKEKFDEILSAESVGKYFLANIKGKYAEEKQ